MLDSKVLSISYINSLIESAVNDRFTLLTFEEKAERPIPT